MAADALRFASVHLPTAQVTRALGQVCGQVAQSGTVIALGGRLGAGKTTFVEGLAQGLSCTADVSSPTFTLATEYGGGRLPLYHLDLYRIGEAARQEVDWLDEYLYSDGVTAIEWAELLGAWLPAIRLDVFLSDEGETGRSAQIVAMGAPSHVVLEAWMKRWS